LVLFEAAVWCSYGISIEDLFNNNNDDDDEEEEDDDDDEDNSINNNNSNNLFNCKWTVARWQWL